MNQAQKKILVVEDDPGISEIITIILEENNYQVVTHNQGLNVPEVTRKNKPDLILLDLWMSGMDGQEIISLLQKDGVLNKIPVVVISALTEGKDIAKKMGANDFLAKPFDINDLLKVVKKNLHS